MQYAMCNPLTQRKQLPWPQARAARRQAPRRSDLIVNGFVHGQAIVGRIPRGLDALFMSSMASTMGKSVSTAHSKDLLSQRVRQWVIHGEICSKSDHFWNG